MPIEGSRRLYNGRFCFFRSYYTFKTIIFILGQLDDDPGCGVGVDRVKHAKK